MTTNAVCIDDCAAVDSRWAILLKNKYNFEEELYLDNTGFEKIELKNNYVMVYSGNSFIINKTKEFFFSDINIFELIEIYKGMKKAAWAYIDYKKNIIITSNHSNQIYNKNNYYFMGSGQYHAYNNWLKTKSIISSVYEAISKDKYSGGSVKFVRKDLKNNLRRYKPMEFEEFLRKVKNKELKFESASGKIYDLSDPDLDEEFKQNIIDSIKLENMYTPFEGMNDPMTDEEMLIMTTNLMKIKELINENNGDELPNNPYTQEDKEKDIKQYEEIMNSIYGDNWDKENILKKFADSLPVSDD